MVEFSYEIINQIAAASDEAKVNDIIENSMLNLRAKNNNGFTAKRKYMMNMVMTLRYTRAQGLSPNALLNVNRAIDIFEILRKQDQSNLF